MQAVGQFPLLRYDAEALRTTLLQHIIVGPQDFSSSMLVSWKMGAVDRLTAAVAAALGLMHPQPAEAWVAFSIACTAKQPGLP